MAETTEWSKSDPKDAVVAALTTTVYKLEDVRSQGSGRDPTMSTTTNPYGQVISGDVPGFHGLEKWKTIKGEENITRYGKTYWWCPNQKRGNLYDGMYMEHDPVDGNKLWKEKLDEKKDNRKKETYSTS